MAKAKRTILIFGRTNSGKTAQIGVMAEYVERTTGLLTRLYTADKGGTSTIQPQIDVGLIEPVEMGATNPWIFLNMAAQGKVRDDNGKWIPGKNDKIGMFAFESFRSIAEELLMAMGIKGTKGINVGGGVNVSFREEGDGQVITVGGGNQTHYRMAQERMTEEIWNSLKLPAPYILWTSSVSKDEDTTSSGKVLGPDVIGKALTAETPRWFHWTFRMDVLPAQGGKPERHLMYLGTHADVGAGNAAGLGNIRLPLNAPPLATTIIEPADIVKAIEAIEAGSAAATEALRKKRAEAKPVTITK
jgi:hypothetical protein